MESTNLIDPIDYLPSDIIIHQVAHFLTINQLTTCFQVSSKWRKLLDCDPIWKFHSLREFPSDANQTFKKFQNSSENCPKDWKNFFRIYCSMKWISVGKSYDNVKILDNGRRFINNCSGLRWARGRIDKKWKRGVVHLFLYIHEARMYGKLTLNTTIRICYKNSNKIGDPMTLSWRGGGEIKNGGNSTALFGPGYAEKDFLEIILDIENGKVTLKNLTLNEDSKKKIGIVSSKKNVAHWVEVELIAGNDSVGFADLEEMRLNNEKYKNVVIKQ